MFSFDVEPNEYTLAKKPYETLSRSENAVRLDNMYRSLVRNILNKAAAHFKAKLNYFRKQAELSLAEKQIVEWDLQHRNQQRLSIRQHDKIYPWGFKITSRRYGNMIASRRARLVREVESSQRDLELAQQKLLMRADFIRCGRAWLQLNPPKVSTDRIAEREHSYEKVRTEDGVERIIIRGVEFTSDDGNDKRDVISLDGQEVIVSCDAEAKSIRQSFGVRLRSNARASALLGDGAKSEDALRLIGKVADYGYLDAMVGHHFFTAGHRPAETYSALEFNLRTFLKYRKEITDNYMMQDNSAQSVFRTKVNGRRLDASYVVQERVFRESLGKALKPFPYLYKRPVEPLLKRYAEAVDSDDEARPQPVKLCDPVLWVKEADEFAKALEFLGVGRSFILTGAAGTGKTHMVPGFVSACLANNKTVKVFAGGGALDVIEERCRAFMEKTRVIEVPLFWIREKDYLIFTSFNQKNAYLAAKTPNEKSILLRQAQILRPENDDADVVIIDEATLVSYDASLFETASQIVVIGDVFQIAKTGSVFVIAEASGLPTLRLRRNFRAKNCDIMAWSNIFSYENALVVKSRGRRLSEIRYVPMAVKVNGTVQAEVSAIVRSAANALQQGKSVGIVVFGKKQLSSLLIALKNAGLDNAIKFVGLPSDVQGQEADVVYVSMGAALTKTGRIPANIDGLSDNDGIMHMNVALSRAVEQTVVYSGLLSDDIDLRIATFGQAIIRSVLDCFAKLPTQNQMDTEVKYNRSLA
ncbi:AAA family ATPase [Pseudochrobactrum asaccharolyticum]|uniref:AAA domain-containing protein n=1 Tax=Pseudochrobactrum asaccharolyticum TaxID=354351 RepID=A0A366DN96_9HYPH|nr:AAA family ATPase [Pseudochrobactrum asaccharolyticum]RBO90919.1 AAA domain-containing protein [Pseudochrobactrum asaccharolyticum]